MTVAKVYMSFVIQLKFNEMEIKNAEKFISNHDYGNGKLDKKGTIEAMKAYAKQFIDLAAKSSDIKSEYRQNNTKKWKLCGDYESFNVLDVEFRYSVDKKSILDIKQLIK